MGLLDSYEFFRILRKRRHLDSGISGILKSAF